MSAISTIAERCGCGAAVTITERWPTDARNAASQWRKEHRCHTPLRTVLSNMANEKADTGRAAG